MFDYSLISHHWSRIDFNNTVIHALRHIVRLIGQRLQVIIAKFEGHNTIYMWGAHVPGILIFNEQIQFIRVLDQLTEEFIMIQQHYIYTCIWRRL